MTLLRESLRFGTVGVLNTLTSLVVIAALLASGAHPGWANFFGYAAGLGCSFILNRSWTFASSGKLGAQLPKYAVVIASGYLLNLGVVLLLTERAGTGWGPYLAQLAGMLVYTPFTFVGMRVFVFRERTAPAVM